MKKILFQILIIIVLFGCDDNSVNTESKVLPGEIIYKIYDTGKRLEDGSCCFSEYKLYRKGKKYKTNIPTTRPNALTDLSWLKNEGSIIALLNNTTIIKTDTSGKVISKMYESHDYIIRQIYPSSNDELIILVLQKKIPISENLCNTNHAPFVLSILNLNTNQENQLIIFNKEEFIEINDNPWNANNNQFIFTYNQDPQCKILYADNEKINEPPNTFEINGIYKYDIAIKTCELFIEDGKHGIWSNSGNYISYIKGKEVRIINLTNKESITVLTLSLQEHLQVLQWFPDEDILYSRYLYYLTQISFFKLFQEMRYTAYNVEKQKEVEYDFKYFGFDFTWK